MQVGVYSLEKVLYSGEAVEINCQTRSGEITILDGHEPLITLLTAGVLKIVDENKQEHYIPLSSGFLEISSGNRAKLLVEQE